MRQSGSAGDAKWYWGVDIPQLTRENSEAVLSLIQRDCQGLSGSLVDPRQFLTLHIDQESAVTIRTALASLNSSAVGEGLKEIIDEWLLWIGD